MLGVQSEVRRSVAAAEVDRGRKGASSRVGLATSGHDVIQKWEIKFEFAYFGLGHVVSVINPIL